MTCHVPLVQVAVPPQQSASAAHVSPGVKHGSPGFGFSSGHELGAPPGPVVEAAPPPPPAPPTSPDVVVAAVVLVVLAAVVVPEVVVVVAPVLPPTAVGTASPRSSVEPLSQVAVPSTSRPARNERGCTRPSPHRVWSLTSRASAADVEDSRAAYPLADAC